MTGERTSLPENLPAFMSKSKKSALCVFSQFLLLTLFIHRIVHPLVRAQISLPLAVGFGLSTREHFVQAGELADGVVMGSKIIKVIDASPNDTASRAKNVEEFCRSITCGP